MMEKKFPNGTDDRKKQEAEDVDETLDDSFPASDPPAWTGTTTNGAPKGEKKKQK